MLTMSQINHIKDLSNCGYRISEICEKTGSDPKTIRKYLNKTDYSPAPPVKRGRPSVLDPYKKIIDEWLLEDQKHWYKQRHTAQRIFDRLVKEHHYQGSYDTVQKYLHVIRRSNKERANQELIWEPGCAQVDFGEADFYEKGICTRKKYLTVSFPYSNDGYSQIFGGETAECVCQGLQDIFSYIGGTPKLLIFDNATGVGRKIQDKVITTELFSRFRAHYGFQIRFCNPASGWEKGNVENKVGYNRRNLFVPVPAFDDVLTYNQSLLKEHLHKAEELHYKKQEQIQDLFQEDQKYFRCLPEKKFYVCRYEWFTADGYGKICMNGKHFYSTRPENRGKRVLVGILAHYIDILNEDGSLLTRHPRQYGETRTDVNDYSTSLEILSRNVGAWKNSGLRMETPDLLRDYLDSLERTELKSRLRLLNELSRQYGYQSAVRAMNMALSNGNINISDATVLAARITGYGIDTPPESGPPLSAYDEAFLPCKTGGSLS